MSMRMSLSQTLHETLQQQKNEDNSSSSAAVEENRYHAERPTKKNTRFIPGVIPATPIYPSRFLNYTITLHHPITMPVQELWRNSAGQAVFCCARTACPSMIAAMYLTRRMLHPSAKHERVYPSTATTGKTFWSPYTRRGMSKCRKWSQPQTANVEQSFGWDECRGSGIHSGILY